jgi:hypothetical protein
MVLLTANRSMKDKDSLEEVMDLRFNKIPIFLWSSRLCRELHKKIGILFSCKTLMREESTSTSLPVITIGNADRVLTDSNYRNRCVDRLIEISFDIDDYRGSRRLFIP